MLSSIPTPISASNSVMSRAVSSESKAADWRKSQSWIVTNRNKHVPFATRPPCLADLNLPAPSPSSARHITAPFSEHRLKNAPPLGNSLCVAVAHRPVGAPTTRQLESRLLKPRLCRVLRHEMGAAPSQARQGARQRPIRRLQERSRQRRARVWRERRSVGHQAGGTSYLLWKRTALSSIFKYIRIRKETRIFQPRHFDDSVVAEQAASQRDVAMHYASLRQVRQTACYLHEQL
jgi:hypothetical protein